MTIDSVTSFHPTCTSAWQVRCGPGARAAAAQLGRQQDVRRRTAVDTGRTIATVRDLCAQRRRCRADTNHPPARRQTRHRSRYVPSAIRPDATVTVETECTTVNWFSKISEFDAIRCHILRLKCTKLYFRWGSAPDPLEEVYSAPRPPSCT